jgi:hypothetical protein
MKDEIRRVDVLFGDHAFGVQSRDPALDVTGSSWDGLASETVRRIVVEGLVRHETSP